MSCVGFSVVLPRFDVAPLEIVPIAEVDKWKICESQRFLSLRYGKNEVIHGNMQVKDVDGSLGMPVAWRFSCFMRLKFGLTLSFWEKVQATAKLCQEVRTRTIAFTVNRRKGIAR